MAITNSERLTRAFDILRPPLNAFVAQHLPSVNHDWFAMVRQRYPNMGSASADTIDVLYLLRILDDYWRGTFEFPLGKADRAYAKELVEVRNRWAHQDPFTYDDAARALDTTARLLTAIGSADAAQQVEAVRQELFRTMIEEKRRAETRKAPKPTSPSATTAPGLAL